MEVCVPLNTSACRDISSNSGSSTDPHSPTQFKSSVLSMNDLKTCLTEFLNIEPSPGTNDISNVVREYESKDLDTSKSRNSASEKCLSKCATFPPPCEPKSSVDGYFGGKETQVEDITAGVSGEKGSGDSVNKCHSRSISLPTPRKLVPALKGGREKQGIPPKKLSVTWAPDVYDPIPTSVSHFPSYKNQRYGKKSGKNKQKRGGKGSRGSKDKDKKQPRKSGGGGGSSKLKSLHDNSGVVGLSEPHVDTVDYGSPDPFCGSSFMKKSVTELHFPVAEAK